MEEVLNKFDATQRCERELPINVAYDIKQKNDESFLFKNGIRMRLSLGSSLLFFIKTFR